MEHIGAGGWGYEAARVNGIATLARRVNIDFAGIGSREEDDVSIRGWVHGSIVGWDSRDVSESWVHGCLIDSRLRPSIYYRSSSEVLLGGSSSSEAERLCGPVSKRQGMLRSCDGATTRPGGDSMALERSIFCAETRGAEAGGVVTGRVRKAEACAGALSIPFDARERWEGMTGRPLAQPPTTAALALFFLLPDAAQRVFSILPLAFVFFRCRRFTPLTFATACGRRQPSVTCRGRALFHAQIIHGTAAPAATRHARDTRPPAR
ncbi:hypothetical protein PSPO01_12456 [Paraphaeosphaeria sporulosa]